MLLVPRIWHNGATKTEADLQLGPCSVMGKGPPGSSSRTGQLVSKDEAALADTRASSYQRKLPPCHDNFLPTYLTLRMF